jgi:hypothetical protein
VTSLIESIATLLESLNLLQNGHSLPKWQN